MITPAVYEALSDIGTVAIGSGMAIPLVSGVKRLMHGRAPRVDIKLTSGQSVQLEVDPRLSVGQVSALVRAAVTSANAGDKAGVQRVVEESRAASQAVRAAAAAS